jgi:hypothetical protein
VTQLLTFSHNPEKRKKGFHTLLNCKMREMLEAAMKRALEGIWVLMALEYCSNFVDRTKAISTLSDTFFIPFESLPRRLFSHAQHVVTVLFALSQPT